MAFADWSKQATGGPAEGLGRTIMALTGQAKTDYQREYMRRRRSEERSNRTIKFVRPAPVSVRPKQTNLIRPEGVSDNQWAYIQMKAEQDGQA